MATQHLNLNEQEQLATLKHFWRKYGRALIAALSVLVLSYALWITWSIWQAGAAQKATVRFEELSRAVAAGDLPKVDRLFFGMKEELGASSYTAQTALLNARMNYEQGKTEAAQSALQWLVDSRADTGYKAIARLRISGMLIEKKQYDQAIKILSEEINHSFAALAADRLGDIYSLQNKADDAKVQYLKAYAGLPASDEYRKMIDVKLARLGVAAKDVK